MNIDKVGNFIKELRKSKNWSQETLAEKLYCDRTKINKLENGKRFPKIEELTLLSNLFNVSIEELIAGEKINSNNNKKIQSVFKEYLKSQNTKLKKLKLITIFLSIILLVFISIFTTLYFFQNYKSIRVYRFNGNSENYSIADGLLIISKDKIYFRINEINKDVDTIDIYSEINNRKTLLYSGKPYITLNDEYGYKAFISYDDFVKNKQKIYVVINNERIDLSFNEEFVNNKLYYFKTKEIGKEYTVNNNLSIPNKIKENFICVEDVCNLELENENLIFNSGILSVIKGNIYYSYDVGSKILYYQNDSNSKLDVSLSLKNNSFSCISGNCNLAEKVYKEFYNNYLLKYVE